MYFIVGRDHGTQKVPASAKRATARRIPAEKMAARKTTVAWSGGMAAAILIGAIAALWPALRAARMSPPPGAVEHVTERHNSGRFRQSLALPSGV